MLTWNFYLRRILPVGLFMALTLLCGNLVYLYLTVSFIQMLKARPCICVLADECYLALYKELHCSIDLGAASWSRPPLPTAWQMAIEWAICVMLGAMQAYQGWMEKLRLSG